MHQLMDDGPRPNREYVEEAGTLDRALIEQFPDALLLCLGTLIVLANRKARDLLGAIGATDLVGHPLTEILVPEDRDCLFCNAEPAVSSAENLRFRTLQNDKLISCHVHTSIVRWDGKEASLLTIRPEAESMVSRDFLNSRLIAVVENAPFTFTLKDLDGRYLAANSEYKRILAKKDDDFVGKTAKDLYSEPMAKLQKEMDRWVLESRQPVTIEFELDDSYTESGFRELTKFPIFAEDGDIAAIGGIGIDTTQRQHAEINLLNRENFLSALLECTVDGIVTIAHDGTVRTMNRLAEQMFQDPKRSFIGQPLAALFAEPFRSRQIEFFTNYLRTGAPNFLGVRREVMALRSDGTAFPVEIAFAEVVTTDGAQEFVGALRDISSRKALENQLHHSQKMEAIGQLAGGIAHDFNNLLTVVGINSRLLQQQVSDAKQLEMLESVLHAADRGAALVRQLMAYSRQTPLRPELLDLGLVLEELSALLERTLAPNIELDFRIPGQPWPIRVDLTQLETALLNIVLNARDAMPHGGRLVIKVAGVDLDPDGPLSDGSTLAAGEYIEITVVDEGVGISEAVIGRVFDPFFTTKQVGEGSGLGLSMVYGFARQSGGNVTIESEPDVGTVVKVFLPAVNVDSEREDEGDVQNTLVTQSGPA